MENHKLKTVNQISRLICVLSAALFLIMAPDALSTTSTTISLNDYIAYFYNKHSAFLDETYQTTFRAWHFDIPYYEPDKRWMKTNVSPRYQMSSAAFYAYQMQDSSRARVLVRDAILDTTIRYEKQGPSESFEGAIAAFLTVRLLEREETFPKHKRLFNAEEKRKILSILSKRLFLGLPTKDTENRAALAGVYWYYTGAYLQKHGILNDSEFQKVKERAKAKIDQSIKETLARPDNRYREKGLFSLHYHIVEAFMLLMYGHLANEPAYMEKARAMTDVINSLAQDDGFLDAHIGHRPSGIGAQGYLMAGVLNLSFKNKTRAEKFFNYSYGARFFKDLRHPNRLVWYDTKSSSPIFNDDISFVNMAELALILFQKDAPILIATLP